MAPSDAAVPLPATASDDTPRYRSGAVARMARMPVATLRVWERRYRVTMPSVTASGQRLYSAADVHRLALIRQLTDLGHATEHVLGHLSGCQALLLECNHDAQMLAASSYPPFLKKRVGGQHGHLSNAHSAGIAAALRHPGLRCVVAAHLSRENNRPALARAALAQALDWGPDDVAVADPVHGTPWFAL